MKALQNEPSSSSRLFWLETYHRSFPESSFRIGTPLWCDELKQVEIIHQLAAVEPIMMGQPQPWPGKIYHAKQSDLKKDMQPKTNDWRYDDDIVDSFDPSRIPPRIAFRLEKAREAIVKEITDLLTPHGKEPPAMIEVDLGEAKYRQITKVHSTLVVKRKSAGIYKGRLCIRGDTVPITKTDFASSPTANRCGIKLICIIASQTKWTIRALDISQAFLQAGNLHPAERVILIPPPTIRLPWQKSLYAPDTDLKAVARPNHGFLLLRPLYGSRDAPMRWFLKLSDVHLSAGFRQLQSDVCFFTWRNHGLLEGILRAHVDDLLFTGSEEFRRKVITVWKKFRTGEMGALAVQSPLVFTGMQLELVETGTVVLPQEHYIKELPFVNLEKYIANGEITRPAEIRSTLRQWIGSLILAHQTRPDIGFTLTQISTS